MSKSRKNSRTKRGGHHKWKFILIGVTVVLIALLIAVIVIWNKYQIKHIYVEGSTHYTDDEIISYVMKSKLDYNSVYLSMKYKNKKITGIPFVQSMDVKILSDDTVKIRVYEKSLAGYVEYLGRYFYFDKDGIVVESSGEKVAGIPMVSGLSFESISLYEPLPVADDEVFSKILSMTQLLSKYKLSADRIRFSDGLNMTLYFGNVRVMLGDGRNIDEKITRLQYILPEITGMSGVLDMTDYMEPSDTVTFSRDDEGL